MNIENLWIAAILFLIMSVYSYLRKRPMNFWSGQNIRKSEIKNKKLYNVLNSLMWFIVFIYFAIASYYEYCGDIDTVQVMLKFFTKYIIVLMVLYYVILCYWFRRKKSSL